MLRLRPRERTLPSRSATAAPMGRVPAQYPSQAISSAACQASESVSQNNSFDNLNPFAFLDFSNIPGGLLKFFCAFHERLQLFLRNAE